LIRKRAGGRTSVVKAYRDGGTDEEREDESQDVVLTGPEANIEGAEDDEQWKAPRNAVYDDSLARRAELISQGTE
jgi:hypothetical protein